MATTLSNPATSRHEERIFAGMYPEGILYADRHRIKHGDYARLAFLPYSSLELEFAADCPRELRQQLLDDAAKYQARRGEELQISTTGQTRTLGSR